MILKISQNFGISWKSNIDLKIFTQVAIFYGRKDTDKKSDDPNKKVFSVWLETFLEFHWPNYGRNKWQAQPDLARSKWEEKTSSSKTRVNVSMGIVLWIFIALDKL